LRDVERLTSFERDFDGHVLMRIHLGMIAVMLVMSGVKFSSIQNNVI